MQMISDQIRLHLVQFIQSLLTFNMNQLDSLTRAVFLNFQLPAAVGEAPTFGFSEEVVNMFFKPQGVRRTAHFTWLLCSIKKSLAKSSSIARLHNSI